MNIQIGTPLLITSRLSISIKKHFIPSRLAQNMQASLHRILSKSGNYDGENFPDFASYLVSLACAARNSFSDLANKQLFLGTLIDDAVTSAMLDEFPNNFRKPIKGQDSNQCDIVHINAGKEYPLSFKHSSRSGGIGRTALWFCLRWGTNALPVKPIYEAQCPVLVLLSTNVPIKHQKESNLDCGFYYCSQKELNAQISKRHPHHGGRFLKNNRTVSGYSYLYLKNAFGKTNNQYIPLGSQHMKSNTSRLDYGLTL